MDLRQLISTCQEIFWASGPLGKIALCILAFLVYVRPRISFTF